MITTVIPKLPFIEKQHTIHFYTKQLKGTLVSDYGDYFMVTLDGIELHFFSFSILKPQNSDFMIYLRIDNDIEKYYQNIQDYGVHIHPNGSLEVKAWRQMEFSIVDPNGTLLTFGQSI